MVAVADAEDAALCRRINEGGGRVLALLDGHGGEPPADATLKLPVAVDELLDAARSLATL